MMPSSERVFEPYASVALEDGLRPGGQRAVALVVSFSPELAPRRARASLLTLAARVELATPAAETWQVLFEMNAQNTGRVWLALVGGDDAEAWRATAVLRRVAPYAK